MSQQQQHAPGFGFDTGNNNAVWLSNGYLETAVSGAVGTVGDRHTDPALLRYRQVNLHTPEHPRNRPLSYGIECSAGETSICEH